MKVFWLNGGLHAEPESTEEHAALSVIYRSVRKTSLAEETRIARESSDISGLLDELNKLSVRDSQIVPVSASSDFGNEQSVISAQQR
jgi:hypothetical protein